MDAALEIGGGEAAAGQQVGRPPRVLRGAAVRGADQGEVGVGEGEALDAAGHDQGQGLERLGGGAQVGGGARIAQAGHPPPFRGRHRHRAEVPRLREAAPDDRGDAREQGLPTREESPAGGGCARGRSAIV